MAIPNPVMTPPDARTDAPTPTPPVTAADAPDTGMSARDVLGGVISPEMPLANRVARPAEKAGFKSTFLKAMAPPELTTDAAGNIVPKVQTDQYGNPIHTTMSMRGILAGILAGAAKGALGGMTAARTPGENPYVAGARGARALELEQQNRARAIAQQNFENRQKQQQMDIEKAKLMDDETTRKLTNSKISMENYAMEFSNRHLADQYKFLTDKQNFELTQMRYQATQETDGFIEALIAAGAPEDAINIPGVGHGVLTQDDARNVARGNTIMYGTNKHGGGDDDFGYSLLNYDDVRNSPAQQGFDVYVPTLDPKTGTIGRKKMLSVAAGQPLFMAVDAYNAGMSQFNQEFKLYAEGLNTQSQQARIAEERAAAQKTQQDVSETEKEIRDINTPDPTGFKPTLSQKEYDKRADAFTKSKDFATVQSLKGSYQQFQDILNKVNAGQMTGADSVVALFDAVGISATPLAGKGMRINQEVFNEHIGARSAAQALQARFQKINTGGPITPQQIRDYARIAKDVYENSFVNLAEEAHGQGLKINFLPRGAGQPATPLINDIFMKVALTQHPELAKDRAKAIQFTRSMLTATGWE